MLSNSVSAPGTTEYRGREIPSQENSLYSTVLVESWVQIQHSTLPHISTTILCCEGSSCSVPQVQLIKHGKSAVEIKFLFTRKQSRTKPLDRFSPFPAFSSVLHVAGCEFVVLMTVECSRASILP